MTVAVVVKVFDGIVLAADSATTMGGTQVYNNANKVFQLHRTRPVGAMTWGLGQIGSASIATLAKDLRRRLMGQDPDRPEWKLQEDYTVERVVERLIEMFFDELYSIEFAGALPAPDNVLGVFVAGYSGGQLDSEGWTVIFNNPTVRPTPELTAAGQSSGWIAFAQPGPVNRLFKGFDQAELLPTLAPLVDPSKQNDLPARLRTLETNPVQAAMPFIDAIHLARFMVDVTIGFRRFSLGPDTVGGPVEVAGISRHEGFKWISRKHYYSAELNPKDPH